MNLTAVIILAGALAAADSADGWEEVNDSDGIKIWVRDVPGARVREVKAETVIPVEPKRISAVLDDLEHYGEFMPYVVETTNVQPLPNGHIEYQRVDPPFVDMRDYTLRMIITVDPTTGVIERAWTEANDKGPPPRDGVVRVAINRGKWTFKPAPGGKTLLNYYLYTDPGGSIPAWIVNKANTTSLPDLFAAVTKRSIDPAWKRN